jgi:mono/diheme cytochrome c family protein
MPGALNRHKLILMLSLSLGIAARAWPQAAAQDVVVAGLTAAGCAACHGSDGRGTAAGPAITGATLSAAAFVAAVRSPRGAMPAFGPEAVSDETLGELHTELGRLSAPSFPAGRVDVGAALYESTGCYSCHSNQGQGGAQGPRIGPNPIPLTRFGWYLRHPSGQMPPYTAGVLPDQAVADIHAFLQARLPPADGISLLAP